MSRRLQAGPHIVRLVGARHLDMSPIVRARSDLDAFVEAIVKLIDRTDGRTTVKLN